MKLGVFIAGRLGSERLPNKFSTSFRRFVFVGDGLQKLSELPNKYEKNCTML